MGAVLSLAPLGPGPMALSLLLTSSCLVSGLREGTKFKIEGSGSLVGKRPLRPFP